jgi:hypothetical protein
MESFAPDQINSGMSNRYRSELCSGATVLFLLLASGFPSVYGRCSNCWQDVGFQPSESTSLSEAYYANAHTLIDLTNSELVGTLAELRGIEFDASQQPLPLVLGNAGKAVAEFYQRMTNVVADERITAEEYRGNERPRLELQQTFTYLILTRRYAGGSEHLGEGDYLEEYRTDPLTILDQSHSQLGEQFLLTSGFASMWLLFYPSNQSGSKFRYIGQQLLDGHKSYVVCFAQRPAGADVTGSFKLGGRSTLLLYQGLAWIDSNSFQIEKMRLDLLKPRLDVALEKQTTEIHFGEVTLPQNTSSLWLPLEVTVTTLYDGQSYRNHHLYSNYRLFTVKTKIAPVQGHR